MLYPDIWNEFQQQKYCLGAHQREYPEWHKNRERYFIWAIDVDIQLVGARLQRSQNSLAPYLVDAYWRQPHITIAVAGFLSEQPNHNDDVTQATIDQQIQAVQALRLNPFTLLVGGINSFLSAPFVEVKDDTLSLDKIRQVFTLEHSDFRTAAYVPHITVGIYNAHHATAVIQEIIGNEKEEPVEIMVDRIGLYSYAASDIGSVLKAERAVWL